jgi:hypothetical protein
MFNASMFEERQSKFPEPLKIQTPIGTRALVKQAAATENVSAGEFVRRAIAERIARISEGC